MRVVLDTNVLARAARSSKNPAREVLLLCMEEPHVLVLSPFMLSELNRVLRYERVRNIHGLEETEIDAFIENIQSACVTVPLPLLIYEAVVPDDPNDDPVLQTAVIGQATVLCTRDRHLFHPTVVTYCKKHGVEIMDDVALLARLRKLRK